MAKVHNKKRNIGIIYEQMIKFICSRMLENDQETARKGVEIIKEKFKKGTQLNKEYTLFKALATTKNTTDNLAASIIGEAKKACNHMFDSKKLEIEKSQLIKALNHTFGKGVIFKENIENYRVYATIQTLLNEWRSDETSFDLMTEYEIKLHNSLTEKVEINVEEKKEAIKVDNFTLKIMNEVFNKRYDSALNQTQKDLLSCFINNDNELLREKFCILKENAKLKLDSYIKECDNKILSEKYNIVKSNIEKLEVDFYNKENLQKFMTVSKLYEELLGE